MTTNDNANDNTNDNANEKFQLMALVDEALYEQDELPLICPRCTSMNVAFDENEGDMFCKTCGNTF